MPCLFTSNVQVAGYGRGIVSGKGKAALASCAVPYDLDNCANQSGQDGREMD